jgi:lipopolysaccharide/colanic/teichoic acid biosynthesis glycosyltransferase/glycosyltransferase involved in cell wall biosynthesis
MISVIVPARNAACTIEDCIAALRKQSVSHTLYEIIAVDDGSTDDTPAIARQAGAAVISLPPSGAAAARNAGLRAAGGDIVCFTDADCVPQRNWIETITAPLQHDVVGCKGTYRTRQQALIARFVQLEYEEKYDRMRPLGQINFVDTYSAAYRRAVLLANGGFDENVAYVEDQELSFRLAARGYKMVFVPDAVVEHQHSETLMAYFRKKWHIGYWKAQIMRRFPNRVVRDSHTPQSLKLQMLLTFGLYGSLMLLPVTRWAQLPMLLALLALLASVFPFARKAWAKDRMVALFSPLGLAIRATALGLGYVWGVARPRPGFVGTESTIGGLHYPLKRLLDLAGSIVGLAALIVLYPLVGLAVRLSSPGPVLYRQERIGVGGKPFVMLKFRSMYSSADLKPGDTPHRGRQLPSAKPKHDPRITSVGRWLRRWSLDELPQFYNVLKGEMSLVGPRPEEPHIVAGYSDHHRRRLAVKPGMTGPMQVNGRADLSLDERVTLELAYIEHYSILRDLSILLKTVPAVIRGRGAR